jgi:hypothetical protein
MTLAFRIGERPARAELRGFRDSDTAALGALLRSAPSAPDWQRLGIESQADIARAWDATPRWWLVDRHAREPCGLGFDVDGEEVRTQAILLARFPLPLALLEDAFLCLCAAALGPHDAPGATRYDRLRTFVMPRDGWALPALSSAGAAVVVRGGIPAHGLGVAEITRFRLARTGVEKV